MLPASGLIGVRSPLACAESDGYEPTVGDTVKFMKIWCRSNHIESMDGAPCDLRAEIAQSLTKIRRDTTTCNMVNTYLGGNHYANSLPCVTCLWYLRFGILIKLFAHLGFLYCPRFIRRGILFVLIHFGFLTTLPPTRAPTRTGSVRPLPSSPTASHARRFPVGAHYVHRLNSTCKKQISAFERLASSLQGTPLAKSPEIRRDMAT
eukprot:6196309-Pleurochrysis_carterae.AAC.2